MTNKPSTNKGVAAGNKRKSSPTPTSNQGPNAKNPRSDPVTVVKRITPFKSLNDPNQYRVIQLSNGLTAALISRKEPNQGEDISVGPPPSVQFPHLGNRFNVPVGTCSLFPENHLSHREHLNTPVFCGGCTSGNEIELTGGGKSSIQNTSICLVVNVGSLDDPEDCQGLAHFTEHMVHYGSKKFPGENEICVVVANFGTFNAFTLPHSTSYYNQVPDTLLERDLELFSEMLTNPSFETSFLKKEVEAVDNEFYLRLPVFRKYILLPHVAIQDGGHPLTRFACGNVETLTDCQDDAGVQMKEVMAEHFENHYVASAMSLTINSTKSLDELEALTLKHFSTVLQGDHTILHKNEEKAAGQKLSLQNTKGAYTYFQGDTARAELSLIWMLPSSLWVDSKNEKVPQLLKGMLSNTSPNSLDAHLREQGWIHQMRVDKRETLYATILDVTIFLTEAGRKKTDNIIQETFAFITALRNCSRCDMGRFFEEIKISKLREFNFGSQYQSIDDTVDCAMRLQRNGRLETLVCGESWHDAVFNHERMVKVLDQMLSQNSLVIIETIPNTGTLNVIAEAYKAQIQHAPHSGIPYLIVPKTLKLNPNASGNRNGFGLPVINHLLTGEYGKVRNDTGAGDASNWTYTLHNPKTCGNISAQSLPWRSGMDPSGDKHIPKITGVHRGHSIESYDKFRGSVKIQFISQFTFSRTAQTTALGYLWAMVLDTKIHSNLSKYNLAGYRIEVDVGAIQVYGFPKHLEEIMGSILTTMLEKDITPNDFALAKEQFGYFWEMTMTHRHMLIDSIVGSMIQLIPPVDLVGTVEALTLDELNNSIQAFRSCAFCYVTLHGNVPVQTFSAIATALDNQKFGPSLDSNPACSLLNLKYTLARPGLCTPGEKCIRVVDLASPSLTTSVTNAYILGPYDTGDDRTLYFDSAMYMNCQAMLHLRTKKQLGYAVHARQHLDERMRVPVMMFTVHITATAEKFTACELDEKIDEFLSLYGDYLKSMDDGIFNTMKSLQELPDNLTKEQVGNWFNSKFGQDFGSQVPKQIKCIVKGIRKLSVQVISGNVNARTKPCDPNECQKCSNIEKWTPGSCYNSQLAFAEGKGAMQNYFVQSTCTS